MGKPKFKPKKDQIRLTYTTGHQSCYPEYRGQDKVFAVIGPFEGFGDKMDIQEALKELLMSWNKA